MFVQRGEEGQPHQYLFLATSPHFLVRATWLGREIVVVGLPPLVQPEAEVK